MVIVNLCGGLGNQMFQYCFGRYLSIITNQSLYLNINIYQTGNSNRNFDLDIFKLKNPIIGSSDDALKIINDSNTPVFHIYERTFQFDKEIIDSLEVLFAKNSVNNFPHLIISGYWQSEKYFKKIAKVIKKDFSFTNPLNGKWLLLYKQIKQTNSVMLNVRRGDYLEKLDYHGVISIEYIMAAIDLIKKTTANPYFYVFSDDITWCKTHIQENSNIFFVDEQFYDPKYQFYLHLMANCKHFIIANSTFSWWAAWIATNKEKIIICPNKWFTNEEMNTTTLVPSKWIQI